MNIQTETRPQLKAKDAPAAGLFVFQFESLSRNRLGYARGLSAMADDPALAKGLNVRAGEITNAAVAAAFAA